MKVPFDSLTLRAVVSELRSLLQDGIIQHIAQPAPSDLVLTVRSHAANHLLLLSCDAAVPRAHLTSVRRLNPSKPPAFTMACRKYLEGARVEAVSQRGFDRILDLVARDREGDRFTLIAELMGKHSNLILVSNDQRIIDSAKRISHRTSRFREVLPGKLYEPPPAPSGGQDPFTETGETLQAFADHLPIEREAAAARIQGHFEGMSPFLAHELVLRAEQRGLLAAWEELFGAAGRGEWSPVLIRGPRAEPLGAYPFPTVQFPADRQNDRSNLNTALDHFYSVSLPRAAMEAARSQLRTEIVRAISAKQRQSTSLERSLAETARADEYKENGELILSHLHRIGEGSEVVTVTDYYRPGTPERDISLDPKLTPQENANAWFKRYRKARDGAERLQEQLDRAQEDLFALESILVLVDETPDIASLEALRQQMLSEGRLRLPATAEAQAKQKSEFEGKKIRSMLTPEGWEILVGENSEANDYLTARVARPNDLWLHVRANASAHVVIRTNNQPQSVPPSVLRQAAELAARHSPAKHSSLVPVDYTLRKYVRKPKGSVSGAALYQNEKTLNVSPAE